MAVLSRDELAWARIGSAPLLVTLLLPLVIGVLVLLKCILNHCCVRRSNTKEEMFGVEGRMTILSTSEVPFGPRPSNNNREVKLDLHPDPSGLQFSQGDESPSPAESLHLTDSLKRATLHRQLPDLPPENPPRRSSSVLSHDGTSELYATVGYSKEEKPSTSKEPQPSSDSETYGSNHPYAKLKKLENPYARVRNESLQDEETDTDNYDMPQPYAQSGRRENDPPPNLNPNGEPDPPENPVPPRRVARQWRRTQSNDPGPPPPGPPQPGEPVQVHFSGDSQDSRGYTSISVREPLSNIRSQVKNTRNYDSHYATVSDDSEEMYAAIEDPENNYMRISGEDGHPSWAGGPNATPIPERREANSPLPPVPSPLESPAIASTSTVVHPTPPLYAQVTKKKKKAPLTPTVSNSSQNPPSPSVREEPRRWSKADISYSEFEVVREAMSETLVASSSGKDNYQEIDDLAPNPYNEIEEHREEEPEEPMDHYQTIAVPNGFYQEIGERLADPDAFYAKVDKEKKHGYEKLRKLPAGPVLVEGSDEEEERVDEMYERVKYPPYERLKESHDDLREEPNFYEDIAYAQLRREEARGFAEAEQVAASALADVADLSQLYARVDKKKKKKTTEIDESSIEYI